MANAQDLTGQVYALSDEVVDNDCDAIYADVPSCDCCEIDLAFLTTSTFVMVMRCVNGDTFYSGSYESASSNVILNYKQIAVSELLNDDYTLKGHERKEASLRPDNFKIEQCQDVFVLKNPTNHLLKLGARLRKEDEVATIKELASSKALLLFD
jgi:hypothetical protein